MGVSVDLYIGPADGRALSQEAFEALVVDLIRERIVDPPCALFTGILLPNRPWALKDPTYVPPTDPDHGPELWALQREELVDAGDLVVCRVKTDRSAELLAALRGLTWGEEDVAIWFGGLTAPVYESFARRGANGDVVLFAMKRRRELDLDEGPLAFRTYFALTGKGCPSSLLGTPVYPVLRRHFGAELISGRSCS